MAIPLAFPALHASHAGIWIAMPDGETRRVGKAEAVARAAETPMILLNAPLIAQRLGYAELSGLDVLELFAFIFRQRGWPRFWALSPPRTLPYFVTPAKAGVQHQTVRL
jgi:ATP-dependent DNA helicase DinG